MMEYPAPLKEFLSPDKTYFRLKVRGESMNKEFEDGSYLVLEETSTVMNGQFVAAVVQGMDVMVREVQQENGKIAFIPHSSDPFWQPTTFDPEQTDIRILGRVVQSIKLISGEAG